VIRICMPFQRHENGVGVMFRRRLSLLDGSGSSLVLDMCAGKVSCNVQFPQMGGGDVLVFWLGADTEPLFSRWRAGWLAFVHDLLGTRWCFAWTGFNSISNPSDDS